MLGTHRVLYHRHRVCNHTGSYRFHTDTLYITSVDTDNTGMTKRTRQRGLLHNSQLTDSDRRKIRCKERDILQDIRKNAKELATVTSTKFIETTEELNQVYEQICYPREANLDASNLEELNQAVVKQSQSLGSNNCQQVISFKHLADP